MNLKKVLIISPHYPPINSADMHRVRQMLNYLDEFGWVAEVVTVDKKYIESYSTDEILLKSIPQSQIVHYVGAFNLKYTRRIGLGSLSIRSFFQFKNKVNELLRSRKFDLIFFSTTAFHVLALGPYWKKKYNVPFVLDIQDPWRSDFYLDKPKNERPPKFLIAYHIDKFLESRTVPKADGIISVSKSYIEIFQSRYAGLKAKCETIPFAGFEKDFDFINEVQVPELLMFSNKCINVVYIGRGGHDMRKSVSIYFEALRLIKQIQPKLFFKIKTHFLGTSYAPNGHGFQTLAPIGSDIDCENNVVEIPDRFEYYLTLRTLKNADILLIPGSSDSSYTASKVFPYILAKKPLMACFHEDSSVVNILKDCTSAEICTFNSSNLDSESIVLQMKDCILNSIKKVGSDQEYNRINFDKYSALGMTKKITDFFDRVMVDN